MYIDHLNGKVKTFTHTQNGSIREIRRFNEQGHNYRTDHYKDGKLDNYVEDAGPHTRKIYRYDQNEQLPSVHEIIMDENNQVIHENYVNENKQLLWQCSNTYTASGQLLNSNYADETGTTITLYSYDPNGNMIEKRINAAIPTDSLHYHFEYDEGNRLIKKVKAAGNGQTIKTQLCSYENGLQTGFKKYDANGLLQKLKLYRYNAIGQLVRKTTFERPSNDYPSEHDPAHFQEYYDMMEPFKYDLAGQATAAQLTIRFLGSNTVYTYDLLGNQTLFEKSRYRDDFSNKRLTLWRAAYAEYNEQNLLVRESTMETHSDWDDGSEATYAYTFDAHGRMTSKQSGNLTEEFQYNEQGQLLRATKNYFNGETMEVTQYDTKENIISHIRKSGYGDGTIREHADIIQMEYYE